MRAAKLMGISDDKIWAQDGYQPEAHKTKLQNYKKCVINDHCGVCIQLGPFMYRFDSQGYTPYPDLLEEEKQCSHDVYWFNPNEKEYPQSVWYMKTNDEGKFRVNHNYHNEITGENIAFSKNDYSLDRQERPNHVLHGYLSADGKKVIYVAEGQNP